MPLKQNESKSKSNLNFKVSTMNNINFSALINLEKNPFLLLQYLSFW